MCGRIRLSFSQCGRARLRIPSPRVPLPVMTRTQRQPLSKDRPRKLRRLAWAVSLPIPWRSIRASTVIFPRRNFRAVLRSTPGLCPVSRGAKGTFLRDNGDVLFGTGADDRDLGSGSGMQAGRGLSSRLSDIEKGMRPGIGLIVRAISSQSLASSSVRVRSLRRLFFSPIILNRCGVCGQL